MKILAAWPTVSNYSEQAGEIGKLFTPLLQTPNKNLQFRQQFLCIQKDKDRMKLDNQFGSLSLY